MKLFRLHYHRDSWTENSVHDAVARCPLPRGRPSLDVLQFGAHSDVGAPRTRSAAPPRTAQSVCASRSSRNPSSGSSSGYESKPSADRSARRTRHKLCSVLPVPAALSWSPWQRRLTPAGSRQESTPRRFARPRGCFNRSRRRVLSMTIKGRLSMPSRGAGRRPFHGGPPGHSPAHDRRRDRRRTPDRCPTTRDRETMALAGYEVKDHSR